MKVMAVRSAQSHWEAVVRPLWRAAVDDRSRLPRLLQEAAGARFLWSAAHAQELRGLLARRRLRPSDLANQLAAWELALPVRRVRLARRPHRPADTIYA